ncbi:MAG: VWA domain-containing protein [Alphaproteobacteria bacterium]|nr:VWA domain-containing protein [Alphaproteobacteria bacterium]
MWLSILALVAVAGGPDDDEDMIEFSAPSPSFGRMKASFGATPGGAQDIGYFRDRAKHGEIPLPEVITPEGLFSEHDLPLPDGDCDRLLCTVTAAGEARLLAQDDVRWLGQIGFASGLTPETYHRPPLNLVAVVDQSCSMSDQPIDMVKQSLDAMVGQLGDDDQLSIVLYGSGVTTHLSPTRDRAAMRRAIEGIHIDGSTNMEAGLLHAFEIARSSRRSFDGATRVMLFTDERPNVGNTHAEGFMGIAEAGSKDGIGMTTFGVGVQFGAELATKISSVRGGNLFFFPDAPTMREKFAEDFDTFVTELAYDLELEVKPAPGTRIAGIYGIPGDAVEWGKDGSLVVSVKTVFLSKDRGGIYVGFAPSGDLPVKGRALGTATLGYTARDGAVEPATMGFTLAKGAEPVGLTRGRLLVDEATTLKKVAMLHHRENDQVGAYQLVSALGDRFRAAGDPDLGKELELIEALEGTLAKLAGYAGESGDGVSERDEVSGLPILVTP